MIVGVDKTRDKGIPHHIFFFPDQSKENLSNYDTWATNTFPRLFPCEPACPLN